MHAKVCNEYKKADFFFRYKIRDVELYFNFHFFYNYLKISLPQSKIGFTEDNKLK